MEITVRLAEPVDAEGLARVHARAWRAAYGDLMPSDFLDRFEASREVMWERVMSDPDRAPIYVAANPGGKAAGFVVLEVPSRDGDGTAEIAALNVDPDAWGQGTGKALMGVALEHFQREPYEVATLWVVEGNVRARRFYEALGWDYDGKTVIHGPTGVNELHMRLSL